MPAGPRNPDGSRPGEPTYAVRAARALEEQERADRILADLQTTIFSSLGPTNPMLHKVEECRGSLLKVEEQLRAIRRGPG